MEKRIVFKNPDGTCGVIIPAGNVDAAIKDVPDGLPHRIVDIDAIPSDRYFRAAWTDDNDTETVDVSMVKARDIQMGKIRELRNKKLEALDVETMMGKDVQAEKQKLRDLPETFDVSTAITPEDLKQLWPEELK